MNNGNAFLIIDAQYDFCHPEGTLFVPGADEDMKRLSVLIDRMSDRIDHICLTTDAHSVNDISHGAFWVNEKGENPMPFTQITAAELKEGKWLARDRKEECMEYLTSLESQEEFLHLIWPEHCIEGSKGASIDDQIMSSVKKWCLNGKHYQIAVKGSYPYTEHFGIFQAQVPKQEVKETLLNRQLIDELNQYSTIYLAGQAKSHCVATSLKQAMVYAPEFAQKIVVVEDCMSDVPNMGHLGTPIYDEAKSRGIKFLKSTDLM